MSHSLRSLNYTSSHYAHSSSFASMIITPRSSSFWRVEGEKFLCFFCVNFDNCVNFKKFRVAALAAAAGKISKGMTKCGGECKSPWFIHCCFCTLHSILDGFIKGGETARKLKIFLHPKQTIWKKGFRKKKKASIRTSTRLSLGTFQTWSQTHKSWKTHVKKGTLTLLLPPFLFHFQICMVSESWAGILLGADHHLATKCTGLVYCQSNCPFSDTLYFITSAKVTRW